MWVQCVMWLLAEMCQLQPSAQGPSTARSCEWGERCCGTLLSSGRRETQISYRPIEKAASSHRRVGWPNMLTCVASAWQEKVHIKSWKLLKGVVYQYTLVKSTVKVCWWSLHSRWLAYCNPFIQESVKRVENDSNTEPVQTGQMVILIWNVNMLPLCFHFILYTWKFAWETCFIWC